jgi:LacI family transcriptional regulator
VKAAAAVLGYEPDHVARALRTRRTFLVGVAVPDLVNEVFPAIVRGLENVLGDAGYTVILANSENDTDRERSSVRAMISRQVDGLILMTSHLRSNLVQELAETQTPLVLVGRNVDRVSVPSVASDDVNGVTDAVAHLAALGHTRIAFIGGPLDISTGRDRYRGYVEGLRVHGLDSDPSIVAFASRFDEHAGTQACQELLAWTRDFTAIVTASDTLAFGCYTALAGTGLSIPAEVSMVGFGGWPSSRRACPPLTTISVPHSEMGCIGGNLLLAQIRDEYERPQVVRLKGQLVVAGSTARRG